MISLITATNIMVLPPLTGWVCLFIVQTRKFVRSIKFIYLSANLNLTEVKPW